jgi:cation diffusion facilitator family transporter
MGAMDSSIAISAGLTVAKGIVGLTSGSLAILSEAGHSLIDLFATIITYFAVRISGKPADEEHHYGHGKIESVAALAATSLLFVLAAVVFWEAGARLLGKEAHAVEATFWAFAVIAVSIVVDFFRARLLYRVANQTSSQALEADALHFGSDMWSSLAVLVGLGGVALGFPWADALAAAVVAVFICIAGYRLGWRTIETLTDTAPAGAAERISAIANKVRGVVAVDRVRVRPAGTSLFAEIAVAVSRTLAARTGCGGGKGNRQGSRQGNARSRGDGRDRAARARRRVGDGAHHGDRAQPGARRASCHGASPG